MNNKKVNLTMMIYNFPEKYSSSKYYDTIEHIINKLCKYQSVLSVHEITTINKYINLLREYKCNSKTLKLKYPSNTLKQINKLKHNIMHIVNIHNLTKSSPNNDNINNDTDDNDTDDTDDNDTDDTDDTNDDTDTDSDSSESITELQYINQIHKLKEQVAYWKHEYEIIETRLVHEDELIDALKNTIRILEKQTE
jgi:hypothetical protein